MYTTIRTEPHNVVAVRANYGWFFYEEGPEGYLYIGNQEAGPGVLPSCEEINRRLTPIGRHANVTVTMVDEYYGTQNGELPWSI